MTTDRRYGAFLLILVFLLGFFLYTSNTLHHDKPPATGVSAVETPVADGIPRDPAQAPTTSLPVFPIDINKASVQELMLLPGIGVKTAERIVEKRAELGGFREVDDLTAVKWIGRVKLEKIRGLVTVSRPSKGQGQFSQ